jgi:hypothetical protein
MLVIMLDVILIQTAKRIYSESLEAYIATLWCEKERGVTMKEIDKYECLVFYYVS